MNIRYINTIKRGMITNGMSEPMNNAIPNKINTKPRYIGFLVIRKTPSVTNVDDSSNGLVVVWCFLKALFALRMMTAPITKGIRPRIFHGNSSSFMMGHKKWSAIIATMNARK